VKARWFVPLAIFALLAVLLGVGLKLNPREVPSPYIGKPAPGFSLPLLADPQKTLAAADLKGKAWVLNVWASWCAPCREEHPLVVEIARTAQVPVYGMNYKDDPRAAQEWLRKLGDPYVASVRDADGRAAIDWGVYGVPETFVIDRDGIVRYKHVGPLTREVWQSKMQPLLVSLSAGRPD
jgi:cytochrome c biogenesis protein CcmG/thiol:disulfide interchange protein DsbE